MTYFEELSAKVGVKRAEILMFAYYLSQLNPKEPTDTCIKAARWMLPHMTGAKK